MDNVNLEKLAKELLKKIIDNNRIEQERIKAEEQAKKEAEEQKQKQVAAESASTKKDAAQKFVDYLGTDDALSFFAEYGFTANK